MAIQVLRSKANDQRLLGVLDQLNALMQGLSDRAQPLSRGYLKTILAQPGLFYLAAWEDDRLMGVTLLFIKRQQLDVKADIEEVVVAAHARRRGVATKLMNEAEAIARGAGVDRIYLTSNPRRGPANEFYRARGYQSYDTNLYFLPLR